VERVEETFVGAGVAQSIFKGAIEVIVFVAIATLMGVLHHLFSALSSKIVPTTVPP